jgi:DeoR/GlpR family transcriptional regulator of sugar metabolism
MSAARARQLETLQLVRERSEVEVTSLPGLLGVAAETVRRDLRVLEAQGLVRRTYGRVFSVESSVFETSLAARRLNHPEEKLRIAKAVSERIGQAQTLFIDEGFQMQLVAEHLPGTLPLTVVTPALPIATALAARPNFQVIILGGRVRGNTLGVVDSFALDMLRQFNIDLAVVGANGVSIEHGMTTPDPAVGAIKAAAVRNSARALFAGAHHKFGRKTFMSFAQLADFEAIITGREVSPAVASRFAAAGAVLTRV